MLRLHLQLDPIGPNFSIESTESTDLIDSIGPIGLFGNRPDIKSETFRVRSRRTKDDYILEMFSRMRYARRRQKRKPRPSRIRNRPFVDDSVLGLFWHLFLTIPHSNCFSRPFGRERHSEHGVVPKMQIGSNLIN